MNKVLPVAVVAVSLSLHLHAQVSTASHEELPDGNSIVRSAINVPEEQENLFWSIYAQYAESRRNTSECTSRNMDASNGNLFVNALAERDVDASVCIQEMFDNQARELKTKSQYFEKIRNTINGSVALQFLQSEALMELLQRSRMYEGLQWSHPQWNSGLIKDEKYRCDVFEFTLGFTGEEALRFRQMFEQYEFDYSRIVGHELFFFEQYVDNTAFLTPRQCARFGSDFLRMQEDEIFLRKRFFQQMSETFDSNVAARFLALEDYFTIMDKLKVWAGQ